MYIIDNNANGQAISEDLMKDLINNQATRTELTRKSHWWFFNVYFNHYISYPAAPFHQQIFALTEDDDTKTALVIAFRGSSKSTLITMSFPIWAILGKQQKKFVIILGQTQRQARQHLINIKRELEANDLLRQDLGPFKTIDDEWGSLSLVIPKYNARITAASMEQTIRGLRHNQYRPDLIIADDVEDLAVVKTKEGRDKIHQWITGEVIPAGTPDTRIIFVGNLLHEDSLLMRIKDKILNKEIDGKFLEVPLIDDQGNITWPGKFPTMENVEKERKKISNEIAWQREYLLNIVSDEGRVIFPEWIHHYDEINEKKDNLRYIATGVDPAISTKDSADFTAAVSAKVYGNEESLRIYILPNPLNERMDFPRAIERLKQISKCLKTMMFVEGVSYQRSLAQQLQRENISAEEVVIPGQDKRARLSMISHLIKDGKILFPRKGTENLITQLVGFGVEKHDDLVDALTLLVFKIIEMDVPPPSIMFISTRCRSRRSRLSDFDAGD